MNFPTMSNSKSTPSYFHFIFTSVNKTRKRMDLLNHKFSVFTVSKTAFSESCFRGHISIQHRLSHRCTLISTAISMTKVQMSSFCLVPSD